MNINMFLGGEYPSGFEPIFFAVIIGFFISFFSPKKDIQSPIKPRWYFLLFLLEILLLIILKITLYKSIQEITYSIFIFNLFIVPIIMSLKTFGWGKGFFYGAFLSITFIGFDYYFIKDALRIFPNNFCYDWCGIENAILAIGTGIIAGIGTLIMLISIIKNGFFTKTKNEFLAQKKLLDL